MEISSENKILHKELSYKIQGLIFDVRNDLGSGHKESIYQKALEKGFLKSDIEFEKEPAIKIFSKSGDFLGLYRPDFLVGGKIIIETKAIQYVTRQEIVRVYDYLRNSKYELAYLVNFASPRLYVKRFIFTNDKKVWQTLAKFVAICLLFVAFRGVSAAELLFEPQTQEIKTGDTVKVDLFLDAQEEEINAVEGKIILPDSLLQVKEILNGDSIISLWVEQPVLDSQSQISFSGIIPGGFKGVLSPYYTGHKPGKILSLILKAKDIGEGNIAFQDIRILLNDGLGTPAKFSFLPFQFKIASDAPSVQGVVPIHDPDPPEVFDAVIIKDPNMFNGKWVLVFNAQDKGSGIDYYGIYESVEKKPTAQIKAEDWVNATSSPYLLKDQALRSFVYIKAVDKAGNERISELSPENPFHWYENILLWGIILIIAYVIYLFLIKKFKFIR